MDDASEFFECQMCGDCCKGFGGTYLTDVDIETISRHLNIPPSVFLKEYCDTSGSKYVIKTAESGYCIFWDKVCTIHAIKPRMCKQWPFIKGILLDPKNWQSMHSMCPGIRTDVDMDRLTDYVKKVVAVFQKT